MKVQSGIVQYFDHVIKSIKTIEKNSQVFSELQSISQELELLERYVKTTFDTLESNFNSFVKQVNLLSELVEFQRSVLNFKSSDKMLFTLLEFIRRNTNCHHSFFAFKLTEEDKDFTIVTSREKEEEKYRKFIHSPEMEILMSIVRERDMAYLISDIRQFSGDQIHWGILGARSAILLPIKVYGKFLGIGVLIQQEKPFNLDNLSFVNLIVGVVSVLIYQHFYFSRLKARLYKQFRLQKVMEEVKYAEYFEKGPLFIFTLDTRYVVLHANTAAISNLNISEEMIIGEKFLEIIPKTHRAGFQKVLDECERGQVHYFQSPIIGKNKIKHILEFYVSRMELQDNFDLILVLALDSTHTYYRDLVRNRNEMLDELDQFSRTLVNQFNNLLTILVPNISLLRTYFPEDHPSRKKLDVMEKAARRSSNMIQKFLNYDLEEFEVSETGNLNKVIRSFINQMRKEIPKGIKIKFQLDPGLKPTEYFPLRIRRLLKILVDNSVLALEDRENAQIRFSTRLINHKKDGLVNNKPFYLKAGTYLELGVYDNGIGIPEKSLQQVFKPFYSTRIKNEGVGLGLFIAYNIVKDMKGEIFIDSKVNEFTGVYVYLPVKEEIVMDVAVAKKQEKKKKPKKAKPTVLVVDDEYNIRAMIKEIMEMNGYEVLTAGNGRDGVDLYQRHKGKIDLVILDMVMPVMDGRTTFIEIKNINPKQKILIISGYSQKEDLDEILRKGAVGFMRKPFQLDEIVKKIKEILFNKK